MVRRRGFSVTVPKHRPAEAATRSETPEGAAWPTPYASEGRSTESLELPEDHDDNLWTIVGIERARAGPPTATRVPHRGRATAVQHSPRRNRRSRRASNRRRRGGPAAPARQLVDTLGNQDDMETLQRWRNVGRDRSRHFANCLSDRQQPNRKKTVGRSPVESPQWTPA